MKKFIWMMAMVLPLVFVGCGGSDNEPEFTPPAKQYSVNIYNRINRSLVSSSKCDGILYDVNIVSQNGEIYNVGNIANGGSTTYKLPQGYDKEKVMFLILKLGKDVTAAANNDYWTPEESLGKIICLRVYDDRATEIYFTENTKYSSFDCNNIYDFRNMQQSILAKLGQ